MKKLMIATAAIALGASGAFATENCCGQTVIKPGTSVDVEEEVVTCDAHVYQIKMSLKTLAAKRITKNGCDGLYFDNGTRKINGYLWTCCDPCDGLSSAEPYQITLWDENAKVALFNGVGRNTSDASATTNVKVKVTGAYKVNGNNVTLDETVDIGTFTKAEVIDTSADSKYNKAVAAAMQAAEAATGYVSQSWDVTIKQVNDITTTDAEDHGWADTDYADISLLACDSHGDQGPFLRYGKKADKVAMAFAVVNNTNAGDYDLNVAGFGTFDSKKLIAKSASGSVAGIIPSLEFCGEWADFADPCDEFETWCDYSAVNSIAIPATGTWTMKYVNKLKTNLYNTVPAYDRQ